MILLDNTTGAVYEVVVSLTQKTTIQWKHIPEVQPAIMLDEFIECEAVVKASPKFQEAIKKRAGLTQPPLPPTPFSRGPS